MPMTARNARVLTPHEWCRLMRAKRGDRVLMLDANQVLTEFEIVRVDDDARKVRWGLEGVWADREWVEMDRTAGYELIRKAKAKKGKVKV